MRALAPLTDLSRKSLKASPAHPRAAEKTSASSALRDKADDPARQEQKSQPHLTVELVCQTETKAYDPFWDGPRLVPGFVAQLLGQVTQGPRDTRDARAYGNCVENRAALLDLRG